MKAKFAVGIYGIPAEIHLTITLLYGSRDQYEHKLMNRGYSLDKGGALYVAPDCFTKYIAAHKTELFDAELLETQGG